MSGRTGLDGDVADLLAAVVGALNLPIPSIDVTDKEGHYRLLTLRASDVRIALWTLLQHPGTGVLDDTIADIRRRTAAHPITYTPFKLEQQGGAG